MSGILDSKTILPFGDATTLFSDDSDQGFGLLVKGTQMEDAESIKDKLLLNGVIWDVNENCKLAPNTTRPPIPSLRIRTTIHRDLSVFKNPKKVPILLRMCYPTIDKMACDDTFAESCLLVSTYKDAETINNIGVVYMKSADGAHPDLITIPSIDMVDSADPVPVDTMMLMHWYDDYRVPKHKLQLKIGAPLLLMRTIDERAGFIEGTRVIVTKVTDLLITLKILFGPNRGRTMVCPKMEFACKLQHGGKKMEFIRKQFPVKLAFALKLG